MTYSTWLQIGLFFPVLLLLVKPLRWWAFTLTDASSEYWESRG
jgi:hypothetical protein